MTKLTTALGLLASADSMLGDTSAELVAESKRSHAATVLSAAAMLERVREILERVQISRF